MSIIRLQDFQALIAKREGCLFSSIHFVNYKRKSEELDWDFKKDDPEMSQLYDKNEVSYFAIDQEYIIKPNQLSNYKDDITEEQAIQIQKKFPFSEGAPRWVIAFLRQWNNWKNIKDVIHYGNYGGIRVKDAPS